MCENQKFFLTKGEIYTIIGLVLDLTLSKINVTLFRVFQKILI